MASLPASVPVDGRQSAAALDIRRGATRLFAAHRIAALAEVVLASGRRADLTGIAENGDIHIIEIKSSVEDFRADQKWPEYRAFCDRLWFAVGPEFPRELLPEETGIIVADRYGGEFMRQPPEHKLSASRRKAVLLLCARVGAKRLARLWDPDLATRFEAGEW